MLDLAIRQPAAEEEVEAFSRLAWTIFHAHDAPESYPIWRDRYLRAPGFQTSHVIGVYADGQHVGGCLLHRRTMLMGPSSLPVGCVGTVHVHPDYRRRGIAAAVLRAAERQAAERGDAILLLGGIPDFYRQFGYVDVFDETVHAIGREAALAATSGEEITVRPATAADAADVLALYERSFPRLGRFERSQLKQAHFIARVREGRELRLAVDRSGCIRGYFQPSLHEVEFSPVAREVAADGWPAVAALLREHARLAGESSEPPAALLWPLPTDSLTYYALADHLPIRSESRSWPNEGWMARIANSQSFREAIFPLLRDRWLRIASHVLERVHRPRMDGGSAAVALGLRLGEGSADGMHLRLGHVGLIGGTLGRAEGDPPTEWVTLPTAVFVPLLFGYRSVAWAAGQPGVVVPEEVWPVVEALFPGEPFWIPGTDSF